MNLGTDIDWVCDYGWSWKRRDTIISSDGGFRERDGLAAAAWVILEKPVGGYDVGTKGVAKIVAKGATLIKPNCTSSFMAETIVLENATHFMKTHGCGTSSTDSGILITFETASHRDIVRF